MTIRHIPVLIDEVMKMFNPISSGVYVDATIGGGGHTRELLKRIGPDGVIIGMDCDEETLLKISKELIDPRIQYAYSRFSEMAERVRKVGYKEIDGLIMDLGVSMIQLKNEERGFSFYSEAPLDMRMDKKLILTAEKIVNSWKGKEIERLLREYGEEKRATRIARAIVDERKRKRIRTCIQLAKIVEKAYKRRGRIHPATKTFQALRIAVNDELNELKKGLKNAIDLLKKKGRLCVVTYHSLEDRVVKRFFLSYEKEGLLKRLNKKPIVATMEEIKRNPSSRSAKLRGAVRL